MPGHKLIQIVAAESTPEKDAAFEKWYTEVHVPMLFGYEGVKQVSRYRRKGDDKNLSKYMTIYEFDNDKDMAGFTSSPAFAAAIADFEDKKDTVGFTARWVGVYERIKVWEK
jgi:antibiotic biosynthesis monooxygenase (ABM) superfamily enzyme